MRAIKQHKWYILHEQGIRRAVLGTFGVLLVLGTVLPLALSPAAVSFLTAPGVSPATMIALMGVAVAVMFGLAYSKLVVKWRQSSWEVTAEDMKVVLDSEPLRSNIDSPVKTFLGKIKDFKGISKFMQCVPIFFEEELKKSKVERHSDLFMRLESFAYRSDFPRFVASHEEVDQLLKEVVNFIGGEVSTENLVNQLIARLKTESEEDSLHIIILTRLANAMENASGDVDIEPSVAFLASESLRTLVLNKSAKELGFYSDREAADLSYAMLQHGRCRGVGVKAFDKAKKQYYKKVLKDAQDGMESDVKIDLYHASRIIHDAKNEDGILAAINNQIDRVQKTTNMLADVGENVSAVATATYGADEEPVTETSVQVAQADLLMATVDLDEAVDRAQSEIVKELIEYDPDSKEITDTSALFASNALDWANNHDSGVHHLVLRHLKQTCLRFMAGVQSGGQVVTEHHASLYDAQLINEVVTRFKQAISLINAGEAKYKAPAASQMGSIYDLFDQLTEWKMKGSKHDAKDEGQAVGEVTNDRACDVDIELDPRIQVNDSVNPDPNDDDVDPYSLDQVSDSDRGYGSGADSPARNKAKKIDHHSEGGIVPADPSQVNKGP